MRDVDQLRSEGSSQYNSSLDILLRINKLIEYAETASFNHGIDGIAMWSNALRALTSEIKPYLDETERKDLENAKIHIPDAGIIKRMRVPFNEGYYRDRLEQWEDKIRYYLAKKGMGLKAGRNIKSAIAGGG